MSNLRLSDYSYLRMWPRELFSQKEGGQLLIVKLVPELKLPGVYILYKDEEPYYVGRAAKLLSRLHSHANKVTAKHYSHWTHFSAFAWTNKSEDSGSALAVIEAILIAATPMARNGATPRFKRVPIPKLMRHG